MKKCPFCAEQIQDAAVKCRFCGSGLAGLTSRACPFCSAVIPAAAKICPSCGDDVSSGATGNSGSVDTAAGSTQGSKGAGPVRIVGGLIVLLGILYLAFGSSGSKTPSSPAQVPPSQPPTSTSTVPSPAPPVLELQKWSWAKNYDYVEVQGLVKNISGDSLKNVAAVVFFYDANDGFIMSDDALIDYNPLLAGQESPFTVMARWNPAMKKARVEFKNLMGPKLLHTEQSK